jgi:hypothetical protein
VSERLESRLADLAAHVELPPEPDVAARVRARVAAEPAHRGRWSRPLPLRRVRGLRPAFALPLALLALVLGGVAAVPSARSAVLRWLGIEGVRIERVPVAPTPAPSATGLDLGERTTLAAGTLVPSALGRPAAVYEAGERVTLLYRPRRGLPESEHSGAGALLAQFPGRTNVRFIRKFAGPGTRVEHVRVDGEPGFWIAGEAHGLLYEDPAGAVRELPERLAGSTLVWRHGGLTLRLEADVSKSRALAIARSVQ